MSDQPGAFPAGDPSSGEDLDSLTKQFGQQAGQSASGSSSASPGQSGQPPKPAKPIGQTLPEEAKNLGENFGQQLKDLIPGFIQEVLGMKSTDTPEEKAKKQQMLQRYQQLNAEDQAYVRQKMQREQAEKQQHEQEEMFRKQQEQAAQGSDLPTPAGKVSGAGADGSSNAKRATNKLNDDRKKLSSAG